MVTDFARFPRDSKTASLWLVMTTVVLASSHLNAQETLDIPVFQFVEPGKTKSINIDWSREIGTDLGPVTVADGKIFAGSNMRDSSQGVLYCLDQQSGKVLWRAIDVGVRSSTLPGHVGVRSKPCVHGAGVWYVNTLDQLICLDVNGFRDDVNDGQIRDEIRAGQTDADLRLRIDFRERFQFAPANDSDLGNPAPSPLIVDNALYVNTGNGCSFLNSSALRPGFVSRPNAPAILAVDVRSGHVNWSSAAPAERTLYGWASPQLLTLGNVRQVVLPGADGCLYGFERETGVQMWKHDLNSPEATPWNLQCAGSQGFFYSAPAIAENQMYGCIAHIGSSVYPVQRIDIAAESSGYVAKPIWSAESLDFGSSRSTPATTEDHVWVVFEDTGTVAAFDRKSGKTVFSHTDGRGESRIHASPFLVGHYLYAIFHQEVAIYNTETMTYVGKLTASEHALRGVPQATAGFLYVGTRGQLARIALKDDLP